MRDAIDIAEELISLFQQAEGSSVETLNQRLRDVATQHLDPLLVNGLAKLLWDLCEVQTNTEHDPVVLRQQVFQQASITRHELELRDSFDRNQVLAQCAKTLAVTVEQLETMLFSDLPTAQRVGALRPVCATDLVLRYNLALAQGVLLRSSQVTIDFSPQPSRLLRRLFHQIKFRRLMYRMSGSSQQGYQLVLDGPMSLLESTQRYGLQLALFLPAIVAMEGWHLQANLKWGKAKTDAVFVLSDKEGLAAPHRQGVDELEEISNLVTAFERLESTWKVRRCTKVFHFPDAAVIVPDLVFEHIASRRKVYLEAFGYWYREAVFDRVELLKQHAPAPFILAVSKHLRVSAAITANDFPGRILLYGRTISANTVLQTLESLPC